MPETADAIPDNVLSRPIVGEARRFDGAVAPLGWMLCQGQTLKIADNRHLFAILGTAAGGDGKTTFKLPNGRSLIIAAGGVFPATSAVFAQSGRHMTVADSLGEGARPRPPQMTKPPSAQLLADRQLLARAVRVRAAAPVPVSRQLADRIRQVESDARLTALGTLSTANQARLHAGIDAMLAGSRTQHSAVLEMAGALSDREASALVQINDSISRTFNERWAGADHSQARLEAAYFVVSIALTPEQKEALAAREGS